MLMPFIDQGVVYTPHVFTLPLCYQPQQYLQEQASEAASVTPDETIQVYARELVLVDKQHQDLPWLVYFQGGPGFASPRTSGQSGWLKAALQQYRVLLLDQRGTGLSTPLTHQTFTQSHWADKTAQQQCEYLSHFRADNIVRDAEAIREKFKIKQWAILGQSFGGFCSLTYLSLFPHSLSRSHITGGIPSITQHADSVYQATYARVKQKNHAFFEQFPQAQLLCQRIANHLLEHHVTLPNGQHFTVEQFQLIGINFGRGHAVLPMYYLLERAFVELDGKLELSYDFLNAMLNEQAHQTNPIYAILHESIYCQPTAQNDNGDTASLWSAHRMRQQYPEFNYQKGQPFLFTGEMVFPWMFEQLICLKALKQAAQLLAEKSDWPALYKPDVLANNTVPIACAVYVDDMYVEFDYSRHTLSNIPNSKAWMTNEYEHNGLGMDGERIFNRLDTMLNELGQLPHSPSINK
uniref:Alpha/beta fold hydrolase n=2 Tax=Vibrio algicola TaxID=2662262 RepID=A0A5Q0TJ23_9VIBR|nr:alpha/beta fold hydrolase [Vibrio algicola]